MARSYGPCNCEVRNITTVVMRGLVKSLSARRLATKNRALRHQGGVPVVRTLAREESVFRDHGNFHALSAVVCCLTCSSAWRGVDPSREWHPSSVLASLFCVWLD